jgi:hypothetical protein
VREIVYRLDAQQTSKMRKLTLGLLAATIVLDVLSATIGGPWWLVSVFTALFTVLFGVIWFGQRGAYTQVDDWGIKACVFTGFHREAAWGEIEDIAIRTRNRDQTIVVGLRSGRTFSLAAPLNTGTFPDAHFTRKFEDIHEAWTSAEHSA